MLSDEDFLYQRKLSQLFPPGFLKSSGIRDKLISLNIIDKGMETFNSTNNQISSDLVPSSSPFGSGTILNSFSVF
jgi:hypothetical protein